MGNEGDKPRGNEGEESFADLFSDARPLSEGKRRALPPRTPELPRRDAAEPIAFILSDRGAETSGLAPGIDPAHLKRLRAGKHPVELSLDLHGLTANEAATEVHALVAQAWEEGLRCVRVVHGKGLHSEGGAVLKRALPAWLAAPSTGRHILAYCSARPEDGGVGATYILLRRRRAG